MYLALMCGFPWGELDEVWEERIEELFPISGEQEGDGICRGESGILCIACRFSSDLDSQLTKRKLGVKKFGINKMEVTDEVSRAGSIHSISGVGENRMHTIKAVMAATLGVKE